MESIISLVVLFIVHPILNSIVDQFDTDDYQLEYKADDKQKLDYLLEDLDRNKSIKANNKLVD